MKQSILALSCLSLTACPAQGQAVQVKGDAVHLSGRIDQEMAKELLATELAGIRKISIDSGGGEVESALLIADRIRLSGALLVIDRRCFSACASIILPAARRVRIRPGALIARASSATGSTT